MPRASPLLCWTTCVNSCALNSKLVGLLARTKVDVGAVGEGSGADISVHLDGIAAGVGLYITEVHAKSGLHIGTHGLRQRTAASFALTKLDFDIGFSLKAVGECGLPLKLFLLLAGDTFAADLRSRRGRSNLRRRHAHHMIGDAVRLMLQRIIDSAHLEFSLDWTGEAWHRSGRRCG